MHLTMRKKLVLWAVTSLLLLTAAVSKAELSSYRAQIEATRHGTIDLKADGEIAFKMQPSGQWSLLLDIKGGPLKHRELSSGYTVNSEYRPNKYEQRTKFLFVKEYIDWAFQWDQQKIVGKVKKDDYTFPLETTIHDPLSFQLPLRQSLIDGNRTTFEYQFMRYTRPDTLRFEVIGEELLTLDFGRVHTYILKQTKPMKSDEKKLIWVAKDFDFIPLRFTTYKDDKIKDDLVVEKLWINEQLVSTTP